MNAEQGLAARVDNMEKEKKNQNQKKEEGSRIKIKTKYPTIELPLNCSIASTFILILALPGCCNFVVGVTRAWTMLTCCRA